MEIILQVRKTYGSWAIKACSNSDNEVRSPGEKEREHIFEILGLTKICLFWNGFVWSVLLHYQKQISYICTEVMRHHTESEWFWTGTEIARVFFGGCQTMKTYEVMLKMQGKCHMQSNTQQVRQYNIRKTNEISILHVAKKLLSLSLSYWSCILYRKIFILLELSFLNLFCYYRMGSFSAEVCALVQVRHCPFCEKMFESSYYLVSPPFQWEIIEFSIMHACEMDLDAVVWCAKSFGLMVSGVQWIFLSISSWWTRFRIGCECVCVCEGFRIFILPEGTLRHKR